MPNPQFPTAKEMYAEENERLVIRLAYIGFCMGLDLTESLKKMLEIAPRLDLRAKNIEQAIRTWKGVYANATTPAEIAYKTVCDPSYLPAQIDLKVLADFVSKATGRNDPLGILTDWIRGSPRPEELMKLALLWDTTSLTFSPVKVNWLTGPKQYTVKCNETGNRVNGCRHDMTLEQATETSNSYSATYAVEQE